MTENQVKQQKPVKVKQTKKPAKPKAAKNTAILQAVDKIQEGLNTLKETVK